MVNMQQGRQHLEENHRLYEQHGKYLEEEHRGEYLAISRGGKTILGKRSNEVLKKAIEAFGRGNFGIFRVGHDAYAEWLLVA